MDFIGGFSALVQKGIGDGRAGSSTPSRRARRRPSASAPRQRRHHARRHQHGRGPAMAEVIKATAEAPPTGTDRLRQARRLLQRVEDNPFMAGAFHGTGEPDERSTSASAAPAWFARSSRPLPGRRPHRGRRGDQGHGVQDHPRRRAGRPRGGAAAGRALRHRRPLAGADAREGDSVAGILEEMGVLERAAPARPPRWRCSTTRSRRAAPWRPRPRAASPAPSSPSRRTRA